MFINLLLVSMCLCLVTAGSLMRRVTISTADVSETTIQLTRFSANYYSNCIGSDCSEVQSSAQYCASTCRGNLTDTSTLLNSLVECITKESCGVKTSADLDPYNIDLDYGGCYLVATAPKVQLVPKGTVVLSNEEYNYKVNNKMDFVWSGWNLQCDNLPLIKAPSSSTSSCYQELTKYLSFLCPIKNLLPYFGFYFLYWLPCPSNSTSNSSSTVNSFSSPLQFTQSVTVALMYAFPPPVNDDLGADVTETSDPLTRTYSFVFDAGVPVANQPAIQTAIEKVFNKGDDSGIESDVVQKFYKNVLSGFMNKYCYTVTVGQCT